MLYRLLLSIGLLLSLWNTPSDAATTTFLWLPYAIAAGNVTGFPSTGDQLRCMRIRTPLGITNANRIAFNVASLPTWDYPCGVAIYEDSDSGAQITEYVKAGCKVLGPAGGTVSPFTLTAETVYRVCLCSQSTGGAYSSVRSNETTAGFVGDLMTEFDATILGYAATSCTNGDPPPTTGAITGESTWRMPLVVIEVIP